MGTRWFTRSPAGPIRNGEEPDYSGVYRSLKAMQGVGLVSWELDSSESDPPKVICKIHGWRNGMSEEADRDSEIVSGVGGCPPDGG